MLLDACGFSSPGLIPFSVGVLPEETQNLVAEDAALSYAAILSAGGLSVEDCPEPTDLLAEQDDVRGRGIELLFESLLLWGGSAFERDAADEFVFNVVSPFVTVSSVLVLAGFC